MVLPAKPLAAGQETSSPVEENAVEENAASFALPVGVGMFTWTERKKTFSDEEIKARLQGDRVPGLTREILLTHVLRLLDPETWKKDDAVSPADGPLTSRQDLALLVHELQEEVGVFIVDVLYTAFLETAVLFLLDIDRDGGQILDF